MIQLLLTVLLFALCVPNVLFRLPPYTNRWVSLALHAGLFSVAYSFLLYGRESMGNYGETCPNGYEMQADGSCVPTGHSTYDARAFMKD